MDKNAIKRYAVWARRELIEKVSQKALQYGVEDGIELNPNLESINGVLFSEKEKEQRQSLIRKVNKNGYNNVIEEVAYTWFNRFIALRFMEVNGYLPSHIRIFTDEDNRFKPQVLAEALHLEINGIDKEKIFSMKNDNQDEELFRYILLVQCNELNGALPELFSTISDYVELLLPDYLLRNGSVIERMILDIPESDWTEQTQIIGWLYQYYNIEPKDNVFADLKNNIKISKDNIPAATQLFTPDWIVKYMVDNSLGRYWILTHRDSQLRNELPFILDGCTQDDQVLKNIDDYVASVKDLRPEDIKCIDPCMGSGHILSYIFDVLLKVYEEYGYSARDAASSILCNNIYGLDLDERAAQLAEFSLMMKARAYDRRLFNKKIKLHIEHFQGLNLDVDSFDNPEIIKAINQFKNADELGSLLEVHLDESSIDAIKGFEENIFNWGTKPILDRMLVIDEILNAKYNFVITNPPYMSSSGMDTVLLDEIKTKYPDSKADLFAVFIEKCGNMLDICGYQAMITQHAWMFLGGYERLRNKILENRTLVSMAHIGAKGFDEIAGEVVQTTAFVLNQKNIKDYKGEFVRLLDGNSEKEKAEMFFDENNRFFAKASDFENIPGCTIGYWISTALLDTFKAKKLSSYASAKVGLQTGDNNTFVRVWFEVDRNKLFFNVTSTEETIGTGKKWFPYNKGGSFRKWYGNNDYIVNWENDGYGIKHNFDKKGKLRSRPQNTENYFHEAISWSKISMNGLAFRYKPAGGIFDVAGTSVFAQQPMLLYLLGLGNSNVAKAITEVISPTLNYEVGHISNIPVILCKEEKMNLICNLVNQNIDLAKQDWDSFETSWDFKKHPFLYKKYARVSDAYEAWKEEARERYDQVRDNERQLNQLFIQIYGLKGIISEDVEEEKITIRRADLNRDIRSFISYAVGCMFGRYDPSIDGLYYAGGTWDKPISRIIDADNIIPICDDDYFTDDILGKFIDFLTMTFGAECLEENLDFIAKGIGEKGSAREVIRNYFINDFFKDHCSMYSVTGSGKRPIYWLFDSGKKNGFKCLIYMHRYQQDTIARIRTDYIHEQQARYRTAIEEITNRIESASGSDKVKLTKKLNTLKSQNDEIHAYEEKIHHLADQMISIDLDDGVKKNYELFKDVLAKIK